MGLGTLFLYADADADPRRLLNEFALDEDFPLELLHSRQLPSGLYLFVCRTDCSITAYCGSCGAPMCAGCGDNPSIEISHDRVATGWCRGCRSRSVFREGVIT